MQRTFLVSFLLLGIFGVLALADEEKLDKEGFKKDPEKTFKKLDANGDKKVTREEFSQFMDGVREKLPLAKGGSVAGRIFDLLDVNKDDSLTLEEFMKFGELRDRIGKGKFDPEKLKQFREKLKDKLGSTSDVEVGPQPRVVQP